MFDWLFDRGSAGQTPEEDGKVDEAEERLTTERKRHNRELEAIEVLLAQARLLGLRDDDV